MLVFFFCCCVNSDSVHPVLTGSEATEGETQSEEKDSSDSSDSVGAGGGGKGGGGSLQTGDQLVFFGLAILTCQELEKCLHHTRQGPKLRFPGRQYD